MSILSYGSVTVTNVDDGQQGSPGSPGASVSTVVREYTISTSYERLENPDWADPNTPEWSDVEPTKEQLGSNYLWGRLKTTLSDGSVKYSNAVCSRTISDVISEVDKANKSITDKVWQTDIESEIDDYDESVVTSIRNRVSKTETDLSGITQTVSDQRETVDALGTRVTTAESNIRQNADNIALMVSVDGETSDITINEKMIQAMTNQFIVKSPDGRRTVISGGRLSTDAIQSNNYQAPTWDEETEVGTYPYSANGSLFDLTNGNIYTPNFMLDSVNGNAYLSGTIETGAGHIGGFIIDTDAIYYNKKEVTSVDLEDDIHIIGSDPYVLDEEDYLVGGYASLYAVYMGLDGISCGFGKFAVDSSGELYASNATIRGNITATSLTITDEADVAGLIKAINSSTDSDGGSLVKISADKVQFEGATFFDSYSLKSDTIKDVIVEYALSSSASDFIAVSGTAGQWNAEAPDRTAGTYMWQRTGKLVNGRSDYDYTYTCIQGADGGAGGSVTITSITYAVTTTEAQPADSAFTYTTVPTVPEGNWLWCLTVYSSGNKSYSKSKQGKSPIVSKSGDTVTITGADGESVTVSDGSNPIVYKQGDTVTITDGEGNTVTVKDGAEGQGIKGDSAYLHIAWANSSDGATDFSTTVATNKLYMGTYTDDVEADSTNYRDYDWVKIKGDQGKSLTQVTEYYARNNSTTAPGDSDFGTSILTPTANEKYVWNYEVLTWNDNGEISTTTTNKHIVAMYGSEGRAGKSLVSITEYYVLNNDATSTPSYSSFSTTVVSPTADNRYLWNYELLTWDDNGTTSTEQTPRHIAGVYGDRGTSITSVTATNNTEDDGYSIVTISWGNDHVETFRVKNGSKGAKGDPGVIAQWYYGTLLEHKTGTATLVASATEGAVVGSMYLNTDTSDIYQCTEVGNPDNTWIYAGNLASGLLDSIEIGGTNLLRQLPKQYINDSFNAYQLKLTENLVANQTYTVQFWDVDISHTGKGSETIGLSVCWGGEEIVLATMNGTDYFTNGHADHITATFTVTSQQAQDISHGASNQWLNIYNSMPNVSGTKSMEIGYWKLEKGNMPTDWSSAPGDQIGKVQQIYCRSNNNNYPPSKPSNVVTENRIINTSDNMNPNWTIRRMPMIDDSDIDNGSMDYQYCFTCSQLISINGEFLDATEVVPDESHTVIDGGKIITGTVTANALNADDINAKHKLTVGAMTEDAANLILNSNINIGARNLLLKSSKDKYLSHTSYIVASFDFSESLVEGETYTISARVVTSSEKKSVAFYHSGGSIAMSSFLPISDSQVYTHTFTATSDMASQTSGSGHGYCNVYVSNNVSGQGDTDLEGTAHVEWIKIEKGNKATDWSPAPEDLDVHNYITEIDNSGIWVTLANKKPSDSSGTGATGVNITANGMGIYSNGLLLADYGSTTNFYVPDATNHVVAASLGADGLVVSKGKIGGFDLSATQLNAYGTASGAGTSTNGLYRLLIYSNPGTNGGNIAFGAASRETTSDSWTWNTYINHNGYLYAKNANIKGTITATEGKIGNFNIGTALYNGISSISATSGTGVYLGTDGINLGGGKFKVTNAGALTSTSGTIGSFTISGTGLRGTEESTGKVIVMKPGGWAFAAGGTTHESYASCPFRVSIDGALYSTSGQIGGWTITSNGLYHYDSDGFPQAEITKNTATFGNGTNYMSIGYVAGAEKNVWGIEGSDESVIHIGNGVTWLVISVNEAGFRPLYTDEVSLGFSNSRWKVVYAKNGEIQTSDRKDKDILQELDSDLAESLILNSKPVEYMWKDGDHRRTRMGFIAQDMAKICKDMNKNLALVTASYRQETNYEEDSNYIDDSYFGEDVDDEQLTWGMSYNELIAPLIKVVQKQHKEIENLKNRIKNLEESI